MVSEMNRYIITEVYVTVLKEEYCLCLRIVCRTKASGGEKSGHVSVEVSGGQFGRSIQTFSYQVHFSSTLISWIFDILCHSFFLYHYDVDRVLIIFLFHFLLPFRIHL